jgi:hypothetical protein
MGDYYNISVNLYHKPIQMKLLKYYFLLLSFCFMHFTYAQNLEIQWQNCFGDGDINNVSCIAPTSQGYLLGMQATESGPPNYHGNDDIWLIHIDSLGNKLWDKCYGGSEFETPFKIIRISDDAYYIYASTNSNDGDVQSTNHGNTDAWIIKINGSGDIIWERCYGGNYREESRSAQLTLDGGLLILSRILGGGGDISTYYGYGDIWLTKIDSLGNIEWEKTYGNQYLDNAVDILLTSDNGILITAANDTEGGMITCHSQLEDDADVWLLKLDMQGNIIWQYCYGGSYYDLAYLALEVEDGFVISASTHSNDGDVSGFHGIPSSTGPNDIWVFKIDFEGNLLWQRCFGGGGVESSNHLSQTEEGNFIIIGMTSSNDGDVSGNHSFDDEYDIWIFEFSDGGELIWQHCYGGLRNERLKRANPVYKISDYNYVIAANNWLYATDDVECELDNISDAWIFEIKDTTVGISQTPQNETLKVYPNPANNYVVFETENTNGVAGNTGTRQSHTITITNTYGQQITTLQVKDNKTIWDTRSINSGVYFYSLMIGGKFKSGKVIVGK